MIGIKLTPQRVYESWAQDNDDFYLWLGDKLEAVKYYIDNILPTTPNTAFEFKVAKEEPEFVKEFIRLVKNKFGNYDKVNLTITEKYESFITATPEAKLIFEDDFLKIALRFFKNFMCDPNKFLTLTIYSFEDPVPAIWFRDIRYKLEDFNKNRNDITLMFDNKEELTQYLDTLSKSKLESVYSKMISNEKFFETEKLTPKEIWVLYRLSSFIELGTVKPFKMSKTELDSIFQSYGIDTNVYTNENYIKTITDNYYDTVKNFYDGYSYLQ